MVIVGTWHEIGSFSSLSGLGKRRDKICIKYTSSGVAATINIIKHSSSSQTSNNKHVMHQNFMEVKTSCQSWPA
jgi:hypothetical protein